MNTKPHNTEPSPIVVNTAELATLLHVSQRHINDMNKEGRLPAPVRFGRAVRWIRSEIDAWLAAGAPDRNAWNMHRAAESGAAAC